jgi:hypothetical protein
MAYFNHAFAKLFLGTHASQASVPLVSAGVDQGFLTDAGIRTVDLINTAAPFALGLGTFGLFDPNTYLSVNAASLQVTTGAPLIMASTALYQKDKIGPFAGGYQESTKSKMINPKYISRFYRVDPCLPNANVVHVGNTPYTDSLVPAQPACCQEFLCDETYYLRLDVKGSPALRYLSRNAYWTADYYTGCCDPNVIVPVPVDSTLVFINWANQLLQSQIVGPFISIVVYDENGNPWYAPGNTQNLLPTWDTYVSPGHQADKCAGFTFTGAYVSTVFGDCTFYPNDYFEKEPVKILPSEVDETGDPCAFSGLCVVEECCPRQGMGFGETVLRDLILSESYMQNYFYTGMDLRIREVTQGYDISASVNRAALYYRYFVLHSVPRFNNPTGTFDNDQYMIEVIVNAPSVIFESTMATWLTACTCSAALEIQSCGPVCPTPCPVISITPSQIPGATIAVAYNQALSGVGGTAPYVFNLASGTLPNGLSLSAAGVISGTPTLVGTFNFVVRVTDADGCTGTQAYTIIVSAP